MKLLLALMLLAAGAGVLSAADPQPKKREVEPAEIKVSGFGFFGNRELKALVRSLQSSPEPPEYFERSFIEDAVLVLFSRLNRGGYLFPQITARIKPAGGGEVIERTWDRPLESPLPPDIRAREVEFRIEKGRLFYYEQINFRGLDTMPLEEAAHFFIETDALIKLKRNRIYSPDRLRSGVRNLSEALERNGYQGAAVTHSDPQVNTNTGAVTVEVTVNEGLRSYVRSITLEQPTNAPAVLEMPETVRTNLIFSQLWLQDYLQQIRREYYQDGYADVRLDATQGGREEITNSLQIDLRIDIAPGEPVRIGTVRIEGEEKTNEEMLNRRVGIKDGELLNPVAAERARYRLARLGIFDTVELRYENTEGATRDVIYQVDEGKRIDFSILAGYGSYEMLRGGFELEQYNLWGLAHSSRLKAIQSFKASQADYTYTIPQVFGKDFDIFANASGLRREEISFTREEFGGGAGVSRNFREISSLVSARYSYQVLNATRFEVPPIFGLQKANVSSFIFDLRHDMRDNALTPRAGYKVFSTFEVASEVLAGDVDFQRFEMSASYHQPVGSSRWLHFGVSHGFVTTSDGPEFDLPFNKRFFPGGDNSIRGYQFGEAGPLDDRGRVVGAESYGLANIELEQGLTRNLSIVFFADALGNARGISDYPFSEGLYSVGGGLRFKTLIGPARLEYGHNLNRRSGDPSGTLHFSLGFPF